MSRDDYDDDDEPRRRRKRRRFEDDDYDDLRRGGGRSGTVTAVGVLTIVNGSLILLCGLCISLAGIGAGANAANPVFAGNPAAGLMQFGAAIMLVVAILFLVMGALYIAGGIGCVQRYNWGRIMTLVMAGFSGLFGVWIIINIVQVFIGPTFPPGFVPPPGFQQGFNTARMMALVIWLPLVGLAFTHCIMSFVVLLSSRNAEEFSQ